MQLVEVRVNVPERALDRRALMRTILKLCLPGMKSKVPRLDLECNLRAFRFRVFRAQGLVDSGSRVFCLFGRLVSRVPGGGGLGISWYDGEGLLFPSGRDRHLSVDWLSALRCPDETLLHEFLCRTY